MLASPRPWLWLTQPTHLPPPQTPCLAAMCPCPAAQASSCRKRLDRHQRSRGVQHQHRPGRQQLRVQLQDGDTYEATIKDIDKKSDIATIKIHPKVSGGEPFPGPQAQGPWPHFLRQTLRGTEAWGLATCPSLGSSFQTTNPISGHCPCRALSGRAGCRPGNMPLPHGGGWRVSKAGDTSIVPPGPIPGDATVPGGHRRGDSLLHASCCSASWSQLHGTPWLTC